MTDHLPPHEPAAAPRRGRRRHPRPDIEATTDDLVRVLRRAGRPLAVREIREALGIDRSVLPGDVTRFLHGAATAGLIEQTGRTSATRYRPARPPGWTSGSPYDELPGRA